ncbi:hypothetical protein AN958_06336 [Leucoagaricus sp. SymC.cos]|nr:hypothetical protein AN958_06336 [Leucoagaricus sp. SymC.cos]
MATLCPSHQHTLHPCPPALRLTPLALSNLSQSAISSSTIALSYLHSHITELHNSHVPMNPMVKMHYEQCASMPGPLRITEAILIAAKAGCEHSIPGVWDQEQIDMWRSDQRRTRQRLRHLRSNVGAMPYGMHLPCSRRNSLLPIHDTITNTFVLPERHPVQIRYTQN